MKISARWSLNSRKIQISMRRTVAAAVMFSQPARHLTHNCKLRMDKSRHGINFWIIWTGQAHLQRRVRKFCVKVFKIDAYDSVRNTACATDHHNWIQSFVTWPWIAYSRLLKWVRICDCGTPRTLTLCRKWQRTNIWWTHQHFLEIFEFSNSTSTSVWWMRTYLYK